jgi:hypothetical protein
MQSEHLGGRCPFHKSEPDASPAGDLSDERASLTGAEDMLHKIPGREGVQRLDILPLDLHDWMRIDQSFAADLSHKAELMNAHPDLVNKLLPEGRAGAVELLQMMADYLPVRYPAHFSREGSLLRNLVTDESWDISEPGENPLEICGRLVQEDLVFIHRGPEEASFRLVGGSVSFPSNWSLSRHLGKTVPEIHREVPELNDRIGPVVDGFLKNFPPGKPMTRVNFLIHETDYKPQFPELREEWDTGAAGEYTAENIGQHLFLRNERETFRKLPRSGDVVFTLRTYITPFEELTAEQARVLHGLLLRAPERYVTEYKGLSGENLAAILDYLQQSASR